MAEKISLDCSYGFNRCISSWNNKLNEVTEPIIINNFDTGISESPHKGHALMRNTNIEEYPGALKASKATLSLFQTHSVGTFTADAGTDIITIT